MFRFASFHPASSSRLASFCGPVCFRLFAFSRCFGFFPGQGWRHFKSSNPKVGWRVYTCRIRGWGGGVARLHVPSWGVVAFGGIGWVKWKCLPPAPTTLLAWGKLSCRCESYRNHLVLVQFSYYVKKKNKVSFRISHKHFPKTTFCFRIRLIFFSLFACLRSYQHCSPEMKKNLRRYPDRQNLKKSKSWPFRNLSQILFCFTAFQKRNVMKFHFQKFRITLCRNFYCMATKN